MDPVVNPYLSAAKYGITHFDPAQTDAFPYPLAPGTTTVSPLALPQVVIGPGSVMTLASTSPNYMWGCSTGGVSYIYVGGDSFTPMARLVLPNITTIPSTLLLTTLTQPYSTLEQTQLALESLGINSSTGTGGVGGAYCVVDNNNELYVNYGSAVYAIGVDYLPLLNVITGISARRTLYSSTFLQSDENICGLSLTYDGKLIVVGSRSATIFNRSFGAPLSSVTFSADEDITNSIAVDENNGIYIVTNKQMHKLVWTGTTLSQNAADGAWSCPYPTGDTYPTLFGEGSGSTPTLMGFGTDADKLVVITDGKKRMSLIAFWRNEIPAGFTNRIAGQIPVTCGLPESTEYIQSDQSVVVNNYGAFVVNNVSLDQPGAGIPDILARGPILASPIGVERFEWNPTTHSWSSVWARADISSNSMIPAYSQASGMVYVNGYYKNGNGWEVTGLNWNTGQTQHQTIFGTNITGNGFFALIQALPDGDLLFNSVIGPTRVQLPGGAVYPV